MGQIKVSQLQYIEDLKKCISSIEIQGYYFDVDIFAVVKFENLKLFSSLLKETEKSIYNKNQDMVNVDFRHDEIRIIITEINFKYKIDIDDLIMEYAKENKVIYI